MNLTRFLSLLASFAVLSTPALAGPIDAEKLDQRLTTLADQGEIVGLAVAVIEDGEIIFARGYGQTRADGGPVTADTVFRWASLSKGVASTTAMQLVSEGKLSLQDHVSDYATSLRLPGGGERQSTLENVLSHMLGIVPNAYDTRLEDGRSPQEIREALGRLKAVCRVGECHTYQNVAYDVVAEMVESVTGRAYSDIVEQYLFDPLKMRTASLGRDGLLASPSWAEPHKRNRRTNGQVRRPVKEAYYRVPAAGGVNGSIRDLALYARAQMGLVPEALPVDTLQELHTPRVYTRREQSSMSRRYAGTLRDARYALGWRVYKYGEAGNRVVGHRGAVEGYRSLILFDPERDTGVVALWNSESRRPVGVQFEVMDMVYDLPAKDWLQINGDAIGAAP